MYTPSTFVYYSFFFIYLSFKRSFYSVKFASCIPIILLHFLTLFPNYGTLVLYNYAVKSILLPTLERHMKHFPFSIHSFKIKLLISLLTIGLLPLASISVFYQHLLDARISKDIEAASIDRLRYTSFDIKRQMEISDQLLGWITYNTKLQEILTKDYSEKHEKQLDIIQFNSYATEYAVNANIENSIFKILIVQNNGESFQIGNAWSLMDQDAIEDAKWAETYNHSKADQLVLSKDIYAKDTYIFPVSSRIYNNLTGDPIGWCIIAFRNDMYSKSLVNGSNNQNIYLINPSGQCIGHTDTSLIGTDMSQDPMILDILNTPDSIGHITAERDHTPLIAHYYRIPDTNIIAVQETALDSFFSERAEVFRLFSVLIVISAVLVLCLTMYLHRILTRPINTISSYN